MDRLIEIESPRVPHLFIDVGQGALCRKEGKYLFYI